MMKCIIVVCMKIYILRSAFCLSENPTGVLYINPCGRDLVLGGSVSYVTHRGKVLGRCALLCAEEDLCIGYSMPQCSLQQSVGDRCKEITNSTVDEILLKQNTIQVRQFEA